MNLLIDTKCKKMLVAVTERTGALIEALSDAVLIDQDYKDGRYVYRPAGTEEAPKTMDISFVSENLLSAPTPMIDDLTASMKRAEKRYLEEYSKRTAAEKELKELQAKVDVLTAPDEEEA